MKKKKYEYKAIKIKEKTYKRLKALKMDIIKYGMERFATANHKFELKSLSFDNIINFLLDYLREV